MIDELSKAKGGIRVDLAGGYVSLTLDVNLSTLNDADRKFVLDILHRVISRANQGEHIDGPGADGSMGE